MTDKQSNSGHISRHRLAGKPSAGNFISVSACALLFASATAAVFLAGGLSQGSMGIFLAGSGVALVSCPPRTKVDWRLWMAVAGLVLCGSLAFLPARWWLSIPWRAGLEAAPAIALPSTISTEPWTTAFWLAVLALSALVGLFLLAHPLRSKWLLVYALLATLVAGAYAGLAIYAKRSGWHYPFDAGATFGFFPNRNHTATLLVTGSILALGVLAVSIRDGRWLYAGFAASGITTCMVALFFYSGSRAGIVFVLLGGILWVAGLGRAHLNGRLLVSFVVLLLAGAALFLASESEVRGRLFAPVRASNEKTLPTDPLMPPDRAETKTPPFDFRLLIYRDTLDLIRDYPLTGVGLGCFSLVFPQYRKASLSEAAAIHPESDWLMLVSEAGIPAFLCFLVLLGLLGRRLIRSQEHPFWPLRWGCAAAAAAAALHGIVDVPAHRVELGWWLLLLAGWGLQTTIDREIGRSRLQHLIFVLGGIGALVLGTGLIRAEWFGGKPLPPFGAEKAQDEVFKAFQHQDFAGATKMARQALRNSPMFEPLYFQMGALLAQTETDDAESDANFKAQRLLNPTLPSIPLQQGQLWLNDDPQRTTAFWHEALERDERMNRAAGRGLEADAEFFRDLVRRAAGKAALQKNLFGLAPENPSFVLAWLEGADSGTSKEEIVPLAANHTFLEKLDGKQRARFLAIWYAVGDHEALWRFVDTRNEWSLTAWPIRMKQLIDAGKFEQATHEAADHFGVSLVLPASRLEGGLAATVKQEASDPVAVFSAYWQQGNVVAARRVLEEATLDAKQPASGELLRLKAALATHDTDWPRAWQALEQYLNWKGQPIGF